MNHRPTGAPPRRAPFLAWVAFCLPIACAANPPNGPMPDDAGAEADARESGGPADAAAPEADAATPDTGGPSVPDAGHSLPNGTPATVLLDGAELAKVQQTLAGGTGVSPEQKAALQNLIAAADYALAAGTWSVTTKSATYIANGDPHEYASWGPYWWPPDANPPTTPGTISKCPYKQHDGIRNPNVDMLTDRHGLHASSEAIFELALAWYFTGNTAYADQAERVARAWYLDPSTAMKPEMQYAQQPGPCGPGSATGLIEASGGYMTDALDGLAILTLDTRPKGWTASDQTAIMSWMTQFLSWLASSPIAIAEQAALNNHGTWYDALVSSIHLFIGDAAAAKTLVTSSKTKRIDAQINADGSMPKELARATSWHYSNYNVAGLCRLAMVAQHVGVDLWSYQSTAGGSIAKAIDFLIPTATSATPPGPWAQYNDITVPFDRVYLAESYYSIRAAAQYANDPHAQAVVSQTPMAIDVPGRYCSGERFPTGSDFCGITKGTAPFADLESAGAPAVDMWPLIPTCRVPVN
jgi:hypothetical protein